MNESYRIQDKQRVNLNGVPATSFKLFEYRRDQGCVFAGIFFRPGRYNASDAQCYAFARPDHNVED